MRGRTLGFRIGGPITPIVKKLMIINAAVFLFQQIVGSFSPGVLERTFGLHHIGLFYEFKIWQPLTYMFLHGGLMHLLFNLLALWMFAGELEAKWGEKIFLKYYIFSGVGAGVFIAIMNSIVYSSYLASPITIGASGAIYGILLAYGITWPNREVLLYFLFPIKIKYLVIAFGAIEFFGTIADAGGAGGNISHVGHLGGLVSGLLYFRYKIKDNRHNVRGRKDTGSINQALKEKRLKDKQEVINKRIEAKKMIDKLLDKIARDGMSSLSPKERKLLDWARKHYYPDNNDTIH